jgi:hypothetical protein
MTGEEGENYWSLFQRQPVNNSNNNNKKEIEESKYYVF